MLGGGDCGVGMAGGDLERGGSGSDERASEGGGEHFWRVGCCGCCFEWVVGVEEEEKEIEEERGR